MISKLFAKTNTKEAEEDKEYSFCGDPRSDGKRSYRFESSNPLFKLTRTNLLIAGGLLLTIYLLTRMRFSHLLILLVLIYLLSRYISRGMTFPGGNWIVQRIIMTEISDGEGKNIGCFLWYGMEIICRRTFATSARS